MTTMCIEDGSTSFQAQVEAAKAKREALGIVPIEHRPVRESEGVPLHVAPEVPVQSVIEALRAGGLVCRQYGGRYVVRQA